MTHLPDALLELALGRLPGAESARARAHLAGCPACGAELTALEEAGASLALGLPPSPPPPPLLARLLASASAPGRLGFADLLARVFDLPRPAAEAVLRAADDPARWAAAPIPGVALLRFEGGPRVAAADSGLVRFAPGAAFPRHTHLGPEVMVVLEGAFTDDSGDRHGPGARAHRETRSTHAFTCDEAEGCLAAVLLHGGIEIEGLGAVSL